MFPEWNLAVQTFDQDLADSLPYDVLDATKLIPERMCRSTSSPHGPRPKSRQLLRRD